MLVSYICTYESMCSLSLCLVYIHSLTLTQTHTHSHIQKSSMICHVSDDYYMEIFWAKLLFETYKDTFIQI